MRHEEVRVRLVGQLRNKMAVTGACSGLANWSCHRERKENIPMTRPVRTRYWAIFCRKPYVPCSAVCIDY